MRIDALTLEGFRNYRRAALDFDPSCNVIYGETAQGKTNLLEAIVYLSCGKSPRARTDRELLGFESERAQLVGHIFSRERAFETEITLARGRRRKMTVNGVPAKNGAALSDVLHTVFFSPDDLFLIRDGAAARRRFMDLSLCQLRPRYAEALAEYTRLHEHKTRILRDSEEKPSLLSMWEDFSLRMARIGAQIIRYRAYYCRRLLAAAAAVYSDIAPHEALSGVYRTVSSGSDPFASAQQLERELIDHVFRHKNAEIAAKSCLSGPHKDDLELMLDGRSAASFGSQGQVRTCTLSLKLAARELFFDEDGEYPVLLLDDVLSELDPRRQEFVLNRIRGGQVFITCCEDDRLPQLLGGRIFHVKNGTVR